jgi:protein-S-isoprenylcysteine O-methyltransferase Ste14
LTNAQYEVLNRQLAASGGQGILQWHHMASGKWISERNPGYPFFAVLFYLLGLLRVTPLFYGAIACLGLFATSRAWLGKWAGAYAIVLYCFSGAALTFAWRDTMPSFTDASLIAAGFGALL